MVRFLGPAPTRATLVAAVAAFFLYSLSSGAATTGASATEEEDVAAHSVVDGFFTSSKHTNNWAVLVCTSRFWFNYRHMANTLSMYRTVKRLGIPDSQIILMLADDTACNPRNAAPGSVFNSKLRTLDLYGENVEVDYRGYEVSVENFIRVLTGRVTRNTPRSKRLLTDERSNILVYMTGHGGDEFLKFQDAEEISAHDLANAFGQMWEKKRYHEILFMIDTCQANTMYSQFYTPNILATGSSKKGENSLSHHADGDLGVAVIDRFTYVNLEFLEKVDMQSRATIVDLFKWYDPGKIRSHPGVRTDLFQRPIDKVLVTDFFGSLQNVEITTESYNLTAAAPIVHNGKLHRPTSFGDQKSGPAGQASQVLTSTRSSSFFPISIVCKLLKKLAQRTHIFPYSSSHPGNRQHSLYKLHQIKRGEDTFVF